MSLGFSWGPCLALYIAELLLFVVVLRLQSPKAFEAEESLEHTSSRNPELERTCNL